MGLCHVRRCEFMYCYYYSISPSLYLPCLSPPSLLSQSYSAALELLNIALQLSDYQQDDGDTESLLLAMLFPIGSHCDDNPLFVLCRNDPCSFTWTGEEHIHQVGIK